MTTATAAPAPSMDPGGAIGAFFTAAQREAIETVDRDVLVISSSGTGKTAVLCEKYLRLAAVHGTDSVAALTFTKKAAQELRARISERLPPADGRRETFVGTFHAVANTLIGRAVAAGILQRRPRLLDEQGQTQHASAVLERVEEAESGGGNRRDAHRAAVKAVTGAVDRIKNAGYVPVADGYVDTWERHHAGVDGLPAVGSQGHRRAHLYHEGVCAAGMADFNDQILLATRLLHTHRDVIAAGIVAVLADEYQDVNAQQVDMLDALAAGCHVTCVGDDDQSIFAWRGARVEHILTFPDRRPDALVVTLDVNYRSNRDIVEHALRLVSRNAAPGARLHKTVSTPSTAEPPPGGSIRIRDIHADHPSTMRSSVDRLKSEDVPQYAASIVREMIEAGERPGDIGCIMRTNAEVERTEAILDAMGVDVRVSNPNAVASPQLKRLTAWLRVLGDPDDFAAVATLTGSAAEDRVLGDFARMARRDGTQLMHCIADVAAKGKVRTVRFAEAAARFRELAAKMAEADPLDLVSAICEAETASPSSTSPAKRERFWSIYASLVVLLKDAETIAEAVEHIQDRLSEDDLGGGDDAVELSTFHSIKGRQKPVIVLASFIDGVFPTAIALNSKDPRAVDEERRLAYVAMTRARRRLDVIVAGQRASVFQNEAGLSAVRRAGA